jgi:hypothetical protein
MSSFIEHDQNIGSCKRIGTKCFFLGILCSSKNYDHP